ncbi:uncharacterized protein [Palaemon carinicauda]|uniref:uncharacterized protein n=1 Tax=Palaemon carinicauda TaxID=392227 RepID=UPI0035B59F1E
MRLLALLLVIKLATGQLTIGNDVELVPAMANMAQITSLDVQCEKSGMTVNVAFSQPFDGIIFSKGHFSNPACRYLDANSGRSSYTLYIPSEGCGSVMSQDGSVSPDKKKRVSQTRIVNTIIVQNDPTIQEIWDVARTIKCDWVDNFVKSVAFSPFTVGMLDAQEVAFQGDSPIECWMDLKQGEYPNTQDVDSVVKIGETLSLMVYARDNGGMYDVSVKDCYAYGGPDYDNPNVPQIQLTDSQGCVLKDKLISSFYTSRERDAKGEVIVTYAYVKAFKFPDVMDVFMSCNIEVCKGDCDNLCGSTTTEGPFRSGSTLFGEPITTLSPSTTPLCYPGSNDPRCQRPTVPRSTTPKSPTCELGSNDPNCQINFPQQARPSTFICGFGSKDPRCAPTTAAPKTGKELHSQPAPQQTFGTSRLPTSFTSPPPSSVTPFICTPGSLDPRCPQPTTLSPPICFAGSTDPRCPKPTTPFSIQCFPGSTDPLCPQLTSTPFTCTPGSNDPRCPKPTTPLPKCFLGSTDPRCPKLTTATATPSCFPGSTDPKCPKPTTPSSPRCFSGSTDPRCPKPTTTAPPNCFPGSSDPRCPKPTTQPPPRCFPGSTDSRCPKPTTTLSPPNCFPGSGDPRCPKPTTLAPPSCFPGSTDPRCPKTTTTPSPPNCFPGSRDPRCPKPTTTQSPPNCFPGSRDSRCPKPTTTPSPPKCFPGSRDPACPKPTTVPSIPRCFPGSSNPRCPKPTTQPPPRCFPGSSDPRCPKPTTQPPPRCFPGSSDPRCPNPTTQSPPQCFPGSSDPRCSKPTTQSPPRCFPGSSDPRCPKPTTQSPAQCFPGSTDPRCPKPTTLAPTTPATPQCFPGSNDPRCLSSTSLRCSFGSKDPNCFQPTTLAPPNCFPGSKDPRCPKPTTFRPITTPRAVCLAGSKDPRCIQEFSGAKAIPTKVSTVAPTFKPRPTPTPTPRPPQISTTPRPLQISTTPRPPQISTFRPIQKQSPKPTTLAPPRVTLKPRPIPTTTSPIREGFALFPVTQTTPRPTTQRSFSSRAPTPLITTSRPKPTIPSPSLKPKQTPSPKPNRGKQLGSGAPQPKPEPSGKEWEGESRYHAFHNYHFQRGDGRRGRTFGARITRDADLSQDSLSKKTSTGKRPLEAKVPIRLSRSLYVIAPSDIPVSGNLEHLEIGVPKAEAQTSIDPIYSDPLGTVCFPMAIFTASMLGFLFLLLLSSTAALVLYIRQRKPCKGEHTWHEH